MGKVRTLYAIDDEHNRKSKRSIFTLIGELPGLLIKLAKLELAQLKSELIQKAINAGIGIGMFLAAAFLGFFAFAAFIAAAILGIAVALPAWLAALIVGAALFVIMAILLFLGIRSVKKAMPPKPEKTMDSIKHDINAIKGVGRYENPGARGVVP